MLFTDPLFLFYFLPAALLVHRLALSRAAGPAYPARARACSIGLTLIFYGALQPLWLVPLIGSVTLDYWWIRRLCQTQDAFRRRVYLGLSIAQNIGLLLTFKLLPQPLLPAGISFYTFESLSTVIDIYRGKVPVIQDSLEFFGFLGMFPRFLAGPIVRYDEIRAQFERYPGARLNEGLLTFVYGLFLKTVFADACAVFTSYAFDRVSVRFLAAWLGTIAYAMQIYFDFHGYSLMAVGLGRCFGFEFPRNFNRPYLAEGMQDFWRRWHITLSSWLRDYLYFPLGGSRGGRARTLRNLFLTFLAGGIWHGASLTFLCWGAWHAFFLCAERLFPRRAGIGLGRIATFAIVVIGWVFFRAHSMPEAIRILKALATPSLDFNPEGIERHPLSLALAGLGSAYCFLVDDSIFHDRERLCAFIGTGRARIAAVALLLGSLLVGLSSFRIPFLYFQF